MNRYPWHRVRQGMLVLILLTWLGCLMFGGRISAAETPTAKYVFLFIGDGMSFPQFQAASDYVNARAQDDSGILKAKTPFAFMTFPVAASANTYDSTSFCPDSASTATAIATGHRTHSGVLNMDEGKAKTYETIAEKLKKQKGYKIGVISSVNLNHATPAAFFAHQPSRSNYYEIGEELAHSNFDFFAGGDFLDPKGKKGDKTPLTDVIKANGYTVVTTTAEAKALTKDSGKVVIIDDHPADAKAFDYEIDRKDGQWGLKEYVAKGIECLDNDKGFFLMVESGKIDWACHANDAATAIHDTMAFSDAIDQAIAFQKKHPDDTLIVVTGDHECGGMTIGYAGTNYDTYFTNLANQKISYAKFARDYVPRYIKEQTAFPTMMRDVEALFGLRDVSDAKDKLALTDYEAQKLRTAYAKTLSQDKRQNDEEALLYGGYDPLTVTITHILNNKSGIDFTSYSHTGLPVAVFASGPAAGALSGHYDNTAIYTRMAAIVGVQ